MKKTLLQVKSNEYVKRICETKLGIVSQCCKPSNLIRLSKLYFENVALKINVKVCYSAHLSLVLFFFFIFFVFRI